MRCTWLQFISAGAWRRECRSFGIRRWIAKGNSQNSRALKQWKSHFGSFQRGFNMWSVSRDGDGSCPWSWICRQQQEQQLRLWRQNLETQRQTGGSKSWKCRANICRWLFVCFFVCSQSPCVADSNRGTNRKHLTPKVSESTTAEKRILDLFKTHAGFED